MRRSAFVAIITALVLTACAPMHQRTVPDSHRPAVFVVESNIVVDQDPLIIAKGDSAAIVWHLAAGTNYTFPENGITVSSDEFRCSREGDRTFVCQNRHSKPGHYKYTIRVLDSGKALEPLDPFIYNL